MQTVTTNKNSLKLLSRSILSRLENNKIIVFNPKERNELQEDLCKKLSQFVLTEEDLTNQVRASVTSHAEAISEQNFTETAAFQSQKRALKSRMGENELHGFYFQDSLRNVSGRVCKFLFESPLVEDVFEADDIIQKAVMDVIMKFDESKLGN